MFNRELISKYGLSFLSQGKVYLAKDNFSSKILDKLYEHKNTGSKRVYGLLIEKPGEYVEMHGYDRDFFNDCFGILDDYFVPICFNGEDYAELCQVIEFFDLEENRWNNITSNPVDLLYAIKEFQNLPNITNAQVTLLKQAVKAKMSDANMFCTDLNQDSLVKTIYGAVHKQLMVTSILQIKQKHFALLLRFIEELNIFLFTYKVKRL